MEHLQHENIWITKKIYDDAEAKYYENLAKASVTPLAGEVAKARQLLIDSRDSFKDTSCQSIDAVAVKFFEKKAVEFEKTINTILEKIQQLEFRLTKIEKIEGQVQTTEVHEIQVPANQQKFEEDEDDVDLFGSDSDEENEAASKIREERLAAYNAKKSKKPALVAKSNIILDVKPWDDETDMQILEAEVRKITTDGLLWGASKLVPLAYGIHKLQISSVVEDEKVSIDWLQEEITNIEEYVQSVDIAAFNKI